MNTTGTVFVTGASGYVGVAVANAFHEQGWEVIASGRGDRPHRLNDNVYEWVKHDLTVPWEGQPFEADVLVHCAGVPGLSSKPGENSVEPAVRRLWVANSSVMVNLPLFVNATTLLHCSTLAFSDTGGGDIPITETSPTDLHNSYARSKFAAELSLPDLPYQNKCSVRLTAVAGNAYGSLDDDVRRLLPKMVDFARSNRPFPTFGESHGKPGGFRDMVHVGDVADAFVVLADSATAGDDIPPVVVCASGIPLYVDDLGADVKGYYPGSGRFAVRKIPGSVSRSWTADPSELNRLGWVPYQSTKERFVSDVCGNFPS